MHIHGLNWLGRRRLHVCALLIVLGWRVSPAEAREQQDLVRVSFENRLDPTEDMSDRTAAANQPFLRQRLIAQKSATLTDALRLPYDAGGATLPAGTRLFYAKGVRSEYWCAAYAIGKVMAVMNGRYGREWVCLEDSDKDGSFDAAHKTPLNPGAYLPSFDRVLSPVPVKGAYTVDPDEKRAYFETAVVYQKTFNIYGSLFFYSKVREPGDEAWHDVASVLQGLNGGYQTIPGDKLPKDMNMDGARFTVLAKTDQGVTVHPVAVSEGVRAYVLFSVGRR